MGRILPAIVIVLILGLLALIGYAYLGDLRAVPTEQRQDVTLPGEPAPAAGGTSAAPGAAGGN